MSPKKFLSFAKKLFPEHIFITIAGAMLSFSKGLLRAVGGEAYGYVKETTDKLKKIKVLLQALIKGIKKALSIIIKLFTPPIGWFTFGILALFLAITILMGYWNTIVEGLGGFRGTITVDIGKMQELNQDTSAYIDMQNTDGLLQAFYDEVGAKSFYQTFNLRDMKEVDTFTSFMVALSSSVTGKKITEEDIYAQRKVLDDGTPLYADNVVLGFGGLFNAIQYDPRYIITDANKNPIKYLKQADVLGTDDTKDKLNTYFRDFYNKESIFSLSPTLLYDLNEWAYGDTMGDKIVYPEAFTKPIQFVNDFRRIQTDEKAPDFGNDYTYITQRITLDEIQDRNSEFYNDYEHEGLIYTTPGNVVWDYAITDSNTHQIKYKTDSEKQINIGNVSAYALENFSIDYANGNIIMGMGDGGATISGVKGQVLGLGDSLMVGVVTAGGGNIENAGVQSDSIEAITNRARSYSNFDTIFIEAGTNNWGYASIVNSYANLLDVVCNNNPGAKIVISNIPFMTPDSKNATNAIAQKFNGEISGTIIPAAQAAHPECTFVLYDVYSLIESNQSYKASDGLHLNHGGYLAWFNELAKFATSKADPSAPGETPPVDGEKPAKPAEPERTSDTSARMVKLYWKVNDNCMDAHMGRAIDEKNDCAADENSESCFIGPYLKMEASDSGVITLSDLISTDTVFANNKITRDLNKCPRKHLQTAPIFDADGKMVANSRNLFNKTYIRQKTVKASYRNSDTYWSDFSNFVDSDLKKGPNYKDENGVSVNCTEDYLNKEATLSFEQRKCSVIRVATSNSITEYTTGKINEFVSWLVTGDVKNAVTDITAEGVYRILLEYEDYLCNIGIEGTEWEYKYFATSDSDRLKGLSEFTHISYGLFKIPDFLGLKEMLSKSTTKFKYQDTFKAYVESNDLRTVASEYTPVAIITGATKLENGNVYTGSNNMGWGWKYDKDEGVIKQVLGEASMQFPRYYTNNVALESLVEFFTSTSYGEVIYGPDNFTTHWENGKNISNSDWSLVKSAMLSGGIIGINGVDGIKNIDEQAQLDVGNITDIRNDEYSWNPETTIWRPTLDMPESAKKDLLIAKMEKCDKNNGQCGRITSTSSDTDYLPMELKSVRDYGLGSVLSYIESRKVVFKTGVSALEEYNRTGVDDYFKALDSQIGGTHFKNAEKGFYPIQLLDSKITMNEKTLMDSYRTYPDGLENLESLKGIAHEFLSRQGTGNKNVNLPDGRVCSLNGQMNATQYSIICDGKETGLYAFVPHINDSKIVQALLGIVGSDNINMPDQFWDPMGYYLAWFDYAQGYDPDDIWSKAANIIKDGFSAYLDTYAAQELRKIQSDGSNDFSYIDTYSSWISKLPVDTNGTDNKTNYWGEAGKNVSDANKAKFFDQYGGDIKSVDLIDRAQTQRLYLVEEASTFLGEFIYTYKDSMNTTGTMQTEKAIVGDIVWADRYYFLSNYIFAQTINKYEYQKSYGGTTGYGESKPKIEIDKEEGLLSNWWDKLSELVNGKHVIKKGRVYTEIDSKDIQVPVACPPPDPPAEGGTGGGTSGGTGGGSRAATCYETETVYNYSITEFTNYVNYGAQRTLKVDSPKEVLAVYNKLKGNTATAATADKIWINLKVYEDLSAVNFLGMNKNAADLNKNIVHDYSNEGPITTYTSEFPANEGDDKNHYASLSNANSSLSGREGLKTVQVGPPTSFTDGGQIDDSNYLVNFAKDDVVSKDEFQTVVTMTTADMKNISDAIYSIYGSNTAFNVKDEKIDIAGESVTVKTGAELSSKSDDMLVGLNVADRTDEGYPIPLFEHMVGDVKEIMPNETGSFFNGENLSSYKNRIAFKENDSNGRYAFLRDEREKRTSYMYDYLMNFEAYVPLDVKSDGDMQVRGYNALISTRVNYNSKTEATTNYTSAISSSVDSEAWKKVLDKFKGTAIDKQAVSQAIAGIIEVQLKDAPSRTILLYNKMLELEGKSKIVLDDANMKKIDSVIRSCLALSGKEPVDLDSYRKAKVMLEDGKELEIVLPILGYGAVEVFGPDVSTYGESVKTDDYGSKIDGSVEIMLNITETSDDRFNSEKSVEYVSTKFAKLVNKYGSIPYALVAYFYGEDYWDALGSVLIDTGRSYVDWATDDKELIARALDKIRQSAGLTETITADNVNIDLYNPKNIKDVISYVSNTDKRTDVIQSTNGLGAGIRTDTVGSKAKDGEVFYAKWKDLIDRLAAKHHVDPAIITMMWMQESGGSAFAGICPDNVANVCPNGVYTEDCKGMLACTAKNNVPNYNGGGGIGQIHDLSMKDGREGGNGYIRDLPSTSETKEIATVSIYNPKTQGGGYGIKPYGDATTFDMQGWMKHDTRFDPEIAGNWSLIYIGNLIRSYPDDLNKAIISYNTGSVGYMEDNCKAAGGADGCWYDYYLAQIVPKYGNYLELTTRYYSSKISDGTLPLNAMGSKSSNLNSYKKTSAYSSYEDDKLGIRNSGVEVYGRAGTINRDDLDLILVSSSRTEDINARAYEYDLFNFFTVADKEAGEEGAINGDWTVQSKMATAGSFRNLKEVKPSPLSGLPPLFRINSVLGGPNFTYNCSSQFGWRDFNGGGFHQGIDLAHVATTPVFPMAPGKVVVANGSGAYGQHIIIEHPVAELLENDGIVINGGQTYKIIGIKSIYAHLKNGTISHISVGQEVGIGNKIGEVNNSGDSKGNHLHFEIKLRAQKLGANGENLGSTDWIQVDPEPWFTSSWYDEDGTTILPAHKMIFS